MGPIRILIPILFLAVFIIWILYRAVIKKDLRRNIAGLYAGLVFMAVWGIIYYFLLK